MQVFNTRPYLIREVLGALRILVGALIIYHGQEIFHPDIMAMYQGWDVFKGSFGYTLTYIGKAAELLGGILLCLGLFTRVGALLVIGVFVYVTFIVGHGKFWYEDQHPFFLILFGVLFFLAGPGKWSLDGRINDYDG